MHPKSEMFFNPILVSAENLIPGTIVRYTTDESLPTEKSPIFPIRLSLIRLPHLTSDLLVTTQRIYLTSSPTIRPI